MFFTVKNILKIFSAAILLSFTFSQAKPLSAETLEFQKNFSFNFDNPAKNLSLQTSTTDNFPTPTPSTDNEISTSAARGACEFEVYFIDVGQGDSEFIRLPNCKTLLIDGGPSASASSKLAKFLAERNITSLDYVLLTHAHTDHFKGLQYVFDNFSVASFYDTKQDNPSSSTLQKFRQTAQNEPNIKIFYPKRGDTLDFDEQVSIKVLNGCADKSETSAGEDLNNCSIVIKMTYQNISLLFMGDAQSKIEKELIADYGQALKADILKVGHHGSETSSTSEFLSFVKPKQAYVEVGKNSYGLPKDSAIERLEAAGAKVLRTDREGTMRYTIPKDISAQTNISQTPIFSDPDLSEKF